MINESFTMLVLKSTIGITNIFDSREFQRANVLFADLFIDVKPNESIMDQLSLSFIYEDLGTGMDRMKRLLNSVSCTGQRN